MNAIEEYMYDVKFKATSPDGKVSYVNGSFSLPRDIQDSSPDIIENTGILMYIGKTHLVFASLYDGDIVIKRGDIITPRIPKYV